MTRTAAVTEPPLPVPRNVSREGEKRKGRGQEVPMNMEGKRDAGR